jgi:GTP diphosphokinase / guanosine-3',5'-bis(diphosphate) 3'-diphosphatase
MNKTKMPEVEQSKFEAIFGRIKNQVGKDDYEKISFAYILASYGHRDQKRDNGEDYFNHCIRTAFILINELHIYDSELIMAALLHDTLEDSYLLTGKWIRRIFGKKVAKMVKKLTKPKKNDSRFENDRARHHFYFQQIRNASPAVKLLKLCDRLQNMREIKNCLPNKQARKIEETREVYLPLLGDPEFIAAYPQAAEILGNEFFKVFSAFPKL